MKKHREDYCSTYYSNKNFQNTYAISIEPLPCESTGDIPSHILEEIMIPPITRKQPGRPPNNDIRRDSTKKNYRGVKSLVLNVLHLGITKKLAQNLCSRISIGN
ncbi:hypothetical protein H5410_013413 [Solanum commersonii]|uniref:Uncharacterized protein n=1 Tax=Solanum commersonii TaxID=4109 RepID=A0A9J6AVB4_SOLCO|nr:hypothetical protein H5410_013413 [Solanum commersonii]